MTQRSMTDEQLQAKYGYDKEPWVSPAGWRFDSNPIGDNIFDPRPECIPSREKARNCKCKWCDPACKFALARPCCGACMEADAFDRSPVNPILSAFRDSGYPDQQDTQNGARIWLADHNTYLYSDATPEQVEFARAVLTRLAGVTA